MTHTEILASLPDSTRARLTERSNRAGLVHLAGYLGALCVTSLWILLDGPFWPVAVLLQGVLLVFLFTLSHECTHQTPFRSAWINDVVGHAVAPVLLLPFVWFRYFHLAHHRHTNDPDLDPELADGGRPATWGRWLVYLSGWLYWSGMMRVIWSNAFGVIDAPYLPPRKHGAMRREARILLAIYALAALSLFLSPVLLWLWLVPVVLGQPALRLYLLAEHGLCPPVADMLENTRTTLTGRLVRFVAWNMPYHAEHHAWPSVPFHHLAELHTELAPHLKSVSHGYVAFTTDYVATLER